ncbi:hypothetical protein JCM19298_2324 [Nonlabens ulvanivorans]|nr:hypothetical protein JCM19298_2324 [Nonlabens ulvanivorans]
MKKYLALLAAATLTFTSCNNDDDNSGNIATKNLTLDLQGLEDLGSGYAYEGWVMVDGLPITTGVFTVDDTGNLSQTSFTVDAATLDAATAFILTIEPSPDPDLLLQTQNTSQENSIIILLVYQQILDQHLVISVWPAVVSF